LVEDLKKDRAHARMLLNPAGEWATPPCPLLLPLT